MWERRGCTENSVPTEAQGEGRQQPQGRVRNSAQFPLDLRTQNAGQGTLEQFLREKILGKRHEYLNIDTTATKMPKTTKSFNAHDHTSQQPPLGSEKMGSQETKSCP